jgi:hypothetical protein
MPGTLIPGTEAGKFVATCSSGRRGDTAAMHEAHREPESGAVGLEGYCE